MLIFCTVVANLWDLINDWIIELGFLDYKLSDSTKILGDLKNGTVIDFIILFIKNVIHDAFKQEKNHLYFI